MYFKVKRAKKITMANPLADCSPSEHEVCPMPLANANSPSYARRCWPTLHLVPVVQFLHDNTSLCRAILYSIMSVWVRLELSMSRDLLRWVLCWWCGNFVCCYSHAVTALCKRLQFQLKNARKENTPIQFLFLSKITFNSTRVIMQLLLFECLFIATYVWIIATKQKCQKLCMMPRLS